MSHCLFLSWSLKAVQTQGTVTQTVYGLMIQILIKCTYCFPVRILITSGHNCEHVTTFGLSGNMHFLTSFDREDPELFEQEFAQDSNYKLVNLSRI